MLSSLTKEKAAVRQNSQSMFEGLMRDSYRQAYSLALRLSGNTGEAEDLVQETYVRAFRFFHRYDSALPFTSWLFRIMTNVHIDAVRRRSRLKLVSMDQAGVDGSTTWDLPDLEASPEARILERSLEEPIQLALQSMTSEFRIAVLLADVQGMAYEEIAEVMQTSIGTVRSRIHRGRKQLRAYLDRVCPGQYAEVDA